MDISEFGYVWTTEKDDYVLVETDYGYAVINKRTQMMLCISDDDANGLVIEKMLEAGNRVYESILDAYSDV